MSEGAVVREDRYHVALFDGTNYASWKLRVRVLLEEYELWDCVESDVGEIPEIVVKPEDAPAAQTAKQNRRELELKRRRKCRRLLIERIHDSHLEYVHDKVSPKQIWCTLQDVFQRKSIATRMHLKRQIVGMRFESGRLADHFLRFDRLVREFRGTGAVMEELDAVCHLLLSLGTAFPAVVTSIETMAEDNLTMEFVKCRLLDEETKQQGMGERESEMAAFYGARQQKKLRCFSCKKEGHKSVDCPAKKKQHSESANVAGSSERNSVCFVGVRGAEPQKKQRQVKWFLDSGASDHLARDKQLFTDLHRLSEPIEIAVAKNGQSVVAEHCGTVKMTAFVNGRSIECTVKNVLFTPHLRHNRKEGASPFSFLSGIAKPTNGTAATTSALGASIFATTDPSKKVFSGFGSPPKEAGGAGKDAGDEEYAANVKALNVAVAAWISEKVKENPVCKLTPIFKDYEKYLDEIEAKKSSGKVDTKESTAAKPATSGFTFGSVAPATTTTPAAAPTPVAAKPFSFGFGATSSTPGTGFSFANVAKPAEDAKPDEKATADDDEDEPPKVEFTPVEEKDSIFSKRCKLFVKADGNYSDRGIGTLHIKKVDGKVQVLVRADTSLGQIMLNIILNEAVPVQRMGKNNVMMVCVPTPETKPPPTSVLLRVKTGEEADELYETLIKHKPK